MSVMIKIICIAAELLIQRRGGGVDVTPTTANTPASDIPELIMMADDVERIVTRKERESQNHDGTTELMEFAQGEKGPRLNKGPGIRVLRSQ